MTPRTSVPALLRPQLFCRLSTITGLLLLLAAGPLRATVTNLAYWRLGDNDPGAANGTTATSTTNLQGGTLGLAGNVVYTTNISLTAAGALNSGYGLQFSTGAYGTNALFAVLTNNCGMELWVKPAVTNTTQCLVYHGHSSFNGFGLYLINGNYSGLIGSQLIFPAGPATPNVWTHLAFVRNNGTNIIYTNGVAATTNLVIPVLPVGIMAVGAQPQSLTADLFAGSLDEIRFFTFAPGGFTRSDLLLPPPPIASSLSPSTGPTAGGTLITLSGANFRTNGTLTFAGTNITTLSWISNRITFSLPPGQGAAQPVIAATAGQTSAPVFFSYAAPVISGLSPNTGPTLGGTIITLSGSNFGISGTANIGGVQASNLAWGHSQIMIASPVGQGLSQAVVVTAGGQSSPPSSFNYDAPIISSLTPTNGPTVGSTVITLTGTNFGTTGTVTIGGVVAAANSWLHSRIVATTPAGAGANQSVVVTVSGQTSPSANFNYDAPSITSVNPSTGPTLGGTVITLQGSSFGTSSTVAFDGIGVSATNLSHSEIRFTLPAGQGTNHAIVVTTAGQSSAPARFDYSSPVIASVNPTFGPTVGGTTVTLTGTNFGSSGTVTIGGAVATNVSWSHSQILCKSPVGQGQNQPVVVTAGGQSSPVANFSYQPPSISIIGPTTGPTAGGIVVTLSGLNFGTNGTVTVGGRSATNLNEPWQQDKVAFYLPPGQGVNQTVTLTVSGQSVNAPLPINYNPPTITSVSPNTGPTLGNTIITVTGTNFGTSGSVTIGGASAPSTNWSDAQVQCVLPAGQGTNHAVVVTVSGQASPSARFDYNGPVIQSLTPANGSTAGNTIITLTGTNFGTSGTVTIGGVATTSNIWSHSQIIATTPAGAGANQSVVVTVSGQSSPAASFNYDAPSITSVNPSTGPTAGGTTITLIGSSFGTSSTVAFAGVGVSATYLSHSEVRFLLPAGQGTNHAIVVTTAGQSSAPARFDYNAPLITSLNPTSGPTTGGTVITLTGTNFGTSGMVTIGGAVATNVSWADSQILCTSPVGQGLNQPVVVTVGGQSSPVANFSYQPPTISLITPTTGPTAGGAVVTLLGANFGTNGTLTVGGRSATNLFEPWQQNKVAFYLPAGQGTNQTVTLTVSGQSVNAPQPINYNPPTITSVSPNTGPTLGGTVITLSGTNFGLSGTVSVGANIAPVVAWSHSQVECTLPPGGGVNLPVVLTAGGQSSPAASFSYAAPSVLSLNPAHGPTAGGTVITITGTNFGTSGTVSIGGANATVIGGTWTQSSLQCTLPAGQGANRPVIVTSSAQASTPAGFDYDAPLLLGVSPSSGPTAGGTVITINGLNFGTSGTVTIGGFNAPAVANGWTNTQIRCITPPGVGESLPVIVNVSGQLSSVGAFSYLRPSLNLIGTGGNLTLTWPTNATDYQLEQATAPAGFWSIYPEEITTNAGTLNAIIPVSSSNAFFRLRRQ